MFQSKNGFLSDSSSQSFSVYWDHLEAFKSSEKYVRGLPPACNSHIYSKYTTRYTPQRALLAFFVIAEVILDKYPLLQKKNTNKEYIQAHIPVSFSNKHQKQKQYMQAQQNGKHKKIRTFFVKHFWSCGKIFVVIFEWIFNFSAKGHSTSSLVLSVFSPSSPSLSSTSSWVSSSPPTGAAVWEFSSCWPIVKYQNSTNRT